MTGIGLEGDADTRMALGVHSCDHVPIFGRDAECGEQFAHNLTSFHGAPESLYQQCGLAWPHRVQYIVVRLLCA